MRLALIPHPEFRSDAVTRIDVDVVRSAAGALALTYVVTGAIADLAVPALSASQRTDELWRHTCFEAFLRPAAGEGYVELNFSPSTQWAAYLFSSYREGMTALETTAPRIQPRATDDRFELRVEIDIPADAARLALSAIIEEGSGAKSYWALAHPPGRPDFHHGAGFACQLPERA